VKREEELELRSQTGLFAQLVRGDSIECPVSLDWKCLGAV